MQERYLVQNYAWHFYSQYTLPTRRNSTHIMQHSSRGLSALAGLIVWNRYCCSLHFVGILLFLNICKGFGQFGVWIYSIAVLQKLQYYMYTRLAEGNCLLYVPLCTNTNCKIHVVSVVRFFSQTCTIEYLSTQGLLTRGSGLMFGLGTVGFSNYNHCTSATNAAVVG